MKKILQLLIVFTIIIAFSGISNAEKSEICDFVWSTDVITANDGPDSIWCDKGTGYYVSQPVNYIQDTRGAFSVSIQYDTTWDNSKTIHGVTPCSNTAATGDLNVLSCIKDVCDTGTTTVAYYQKNDIADAITQTFELTPPASGFKLSVDGDTATCWVVRTAVYWK